MPDTIVEQGEFSPKIIFTVLAIFLCVFLFIVALGTYFYGQVHELENINAQENARYLIAEEILSSIQEIEKSTYQLASTPGAPGRRRIAHQVLARIAKLEHDLGVLEKGGAVQRVMPLNLEGQDEFVREIRFQPTGAPSTFNMAVIEVAPHLDQMRAMVNRMVFLYDRHEQNRHTPGSFHANTDSEITLFLKTLPHLFFRINENANRLFYECSSRLKTYQELLAQKRKRHLQSEYAGILLVFIAIAATGTLLYRQMKSSNQKLRTAWEAMRQARDEAELASRSKTQFLANMSHEIRTPMNGVLGLTELLLKTGLDVKQRRYADTIFSCGNSLLSLLNDVLDLSRIEAGRLELSQHDFNLIETLDDVGQLFGAIARSKQNELHVQVHEDVPDVIRGDQARLRQALVNLIGNAVKFTEQGVISLDVAPAHIDNSYDPSKFWLKFSVMDTGIGIASDKLDIIFDAFTQADSSMSRSYGGTGLGLAICKQLVEMMGGTLAVESEVGTGSSFTFVLPFEPAESRTAVLPGKEALVTAPDRCEEEQDKHVLLVEDNPVNLALACEMLEILGYRVDMANNGLEAIERIGTTSYDLVLMDCQMPKLDGYDATRHIRSDERNAGRKRTPIVALTGHALEGERERCLEAGMDDYLSKPFSIDQLQGMVLKWVHPT